MNCQEVQNLIEDAIDRRLAGGDKRRFDLHLARCTSCRARFAAEQREHIRWYRALNDGAIPPTLPPLDFANRLASRLAVAPPPSRSFLLRLPRWARIAASLAAIASLVAFGSWIAAEWEGGSSEYGDHGDHLDQTDCSILTEATTMKPPFAAAAFALGAAVMPATMLQATTDNSCIISGSTERDCASAAFASAGDLDARDATVGFGDELDPFEARTTTHGFGDALNRFRTDEPRGCSFIIR